MRSLPLLPLWLQPPAPAKLSVKHPVAEALLGRAPSPPPSAAGPRHRSAGSLGSASINLRETKLRSVRKLHRCRSSTALLKHKLLKILRSLFSFHEHSGG